VVGIWLSVGDDWQLVVKLVHVQWRIIPPLNSHVVMILMLLLGNWCEESLWYICLRLRGTYSPSFRCWSAGVHFGWSVQP